MFQTALKFVELGLFVLVSELSDSVVNWRGWKKTTCTHKKVLWKFQAQNMKKKGTFSLDLASAWKQDVVIKRVARHKREIRRNSRVLVYFACLVIAILGEHCAKSYKRQREKRESLSSKRPGIAQNRQPHVQQIEPNRNIHAERKTKPKIIRVSKHNRYIPKYHS